MPTGRRSAEDAQDLTQSFLVHLLLATGGRAVMFSKIPDDVPLVAITSQPGGNVQLSFIGKLGIRYHPQSSSNLATWSDEGPAVFAPVLNPPGGGPVSVLLSTGSGIQKFFRLRVSY